MKQRVIHVFTHDSIGLGEDGPTHQSVEHAASLRLIPNLDVWRPCDTAETAVAWAAALREHATGRRRCCCRARTCPMRPSAAALERHRQGRLRAGRAGRSRPAAQAAGGDHRHRLRSAAGAARRRSCWPSSGIAVRVVSMPSHDRVRPPGRGLQGRACCPPACRASRSRWASPTAGGSTAAPRWSASTRYGESAPGAVLFKHFGFTAENVVGARCARSSL